MAELKTKENDGDVEAFLAGVPSAVRQRDAREVTGLLRELTGQEPRMWGDAIIGFGNRQLKYDSGRELDWFQVGLSPRKAALTLYLSGPTDSYQPILDRLGPYSRGKGCIYLKDLSKLDAGVLRELLAAAC